MVDSKQRQSRIDYASNPSLNFTGMSDGEDEVIMSKQNRRGFLKRSAALAGLVVGVVGSGNVQGQEAPPPENAKDFLAYGQRSRFETAVRVRGRTPLQDSTGIITPSSLHFVNTHLRHLPPDLDPRQHRLLVHGLVERPLILTMDDLKRLPSTSRVHFIECADNGFESLRDRNAQTVQQTHGRTSCSEWTGVSLSLLLKEVGLRTNARWLVAEGAEPGKHTISIPVEKAMDDVLVAYGQNGEAIRPDQGYPVRLIVPGWEGVRNVKWLRRIEIVDQPYMTYRETTRYVDLMPDGQARWFMFEMGPNSVITFPSGGKQLSARGFYEITGLAWSGGGAVRRVEVSIDGGRLWRDARLQRPVLRKAHTRFNLDWQWDGRDSLLMSRCTDETGNTQLTLANLSKKLGLSPDYFHLSGPKKAPFIHLNFIQPWKVSSDGSVHNALL